VLFVLQALQDDIVHAAVDITASHVNVKTFDKKGGRTWTRTIYIYGQFPFIM
jgi:hypothetical protein